MSANIYNPVTKTITPYAGNTVTELAGMSDVALAAPSDGQLLTYDNDSHAWTNANTSLDALTDTNLSSPTNGQVLKYNASTGKWVNGNESGGGGGGGTSDYTDLDNKPSIENVTLSGNKSASDLGLAKSSDIPTDLADLNDDSTHRVVTDAEKTAWSGKQDALTAGDGIDITSNEISADIMPSADMAEIMSVFPKPTSGGDFKEKNGIIWFRDIPMMGTKSLSYYVDSSTGVDDYDGGYGLSSSKPFATIEYALQFFPIYMSDHHSTIRQHFTGSLYISGTFSATSLKTIYFEFPNYRFYLYIGSDVVLNNIRLEVVDSSYFVLRLSGGNLTINCNLTNLTSSTTMLSLGYSRVMIEAQNQTAQNQRALIINGNTTSQNYIVGLGCANMAEVLFKTANSYVEINNTSTALNVYSCSTAYIKNIKGTDNNKGLRVIEGATLAYESKTISATTGIETATGGRINTGAQS